MSDWAGSARGEKARKVLHQLLELMQALIEDDEPGHIDLTALNLDESDYILLHETLGEGDILAQVRNFGLVSVVECGYAGVWWVTHMDEQDQVLSEFLEVSYCPEVLIAEMETVVDGFDALKARLFEMGREDKFLKTKTL